MTLLGEKLYFPGLGKDFLDHEKHEPEKKKLINCTSLNKTSFQKIWLHKKTGHSLGDNIYKTHIW